MIESIAFKNFKLLRDTTLPLGPLTLIVGPNGSGKTTALHGIKALGRQIDLSSDRFLSRDPIREEHGQNPIVLTVEWCGVLQKPTRFHWSTDHIGVFDHLGAPIEWRHYPQRVPLSQVRVFALDPVVLAQQYPLHQAAELGENGANLPVVLDRLRDHHPERFEALNFELSGWLPEFDRILFDTPSQGNRSIALRTTSGHKIAAPELSQGTLLALAILTVAYLPEPPPVVGFEEPDRGLHPRLLRDVRDALYRLAYPDRFGESRKPVQVIATTHSPYFLDLFRDSPEEVVIAEKLEGEAKFNRLVDLPHFEEILQDSHLGEVWYSGILGGVPAER